METKKVISISSRAGILAKKFEYLEQAIKEATNIALKNNETVTVHIDGVENDGSISYSVKVAEIRGCKFDKYGKIKSK